MQHFLLIISLLLVACAQDPLLQSTADEDPDNRDRKTIEVTNGSEHAINVCAYYGECFFTVKPGETKRGDISFTTFPQDGSDPLVGISLQRVAGRLVGSHDSSWTRMLSEPGTEFRWAGNFSGIHGFFVDSSVSDLLADLQSEGGSYSSQSDESLRKIALALNNLDPHLQLKNRYGATLEITGLGNDTVLYSGRPASGINVGPGEDKLSETGHIFVKDGWIYTRMKSSVSSVLYNDYTTATRFLCRTGGCFEH